MKLLFSFIFSITLYAADADTLTLPEAIDLSLGRHPFATRKALNQESLLLMESLNRSGRMPQLNLNGQLTYQSEVVDLPDNPLIGVDIPKLQSRVYLEVQQLIYSGNRIGIKDELDRAKAHTRDLETDVEFNKTRSIVSELYFGILASDKQIELLQEILADLERQVEIMESRVESGAALPASVKRFSLERIKVESQLLEARFTSQKLRSQMESWAGKGGMDTYYVMPEMVSEFININTPELAVLDQAVETIRMSSELYNADRKPAVGLFLQGGFGQPNPLNFFETEFEPYYIGGIRLSWNPFDYGNSKSRIQLNELEAERWTTTRVLAHDMIRRKKMQNEIDLIKIRALEGNELEAVGLQADVLAVSKSQYDNGIITASEYLREVNNLNRLRIQVEIRKIMKVKNSWDNAILTGNY